jgi:carboxypeptidase C (cathepsin A)
MSAAERQEMVKRVSRYIGLSEAYVDESDLRIEIQRFCKELLRREGRTVGRLDSRFRGSDSSGVAERPEFDPSMTAIRPPYTATFNDYVRRSLGYKTDTVYHILGGGIGAPWDFGAGGFADTSQALGDAFAKNPDMRLFVASGYYDLATPYFATQYTLSHMGLTAEQRARISTGQYEAGHMMYIHEGELTRLKQDVSKFLAGALVRP